MAVKTASLKDEATGSTSGFARSAAMSAAVTTRPANTRRPTTMRPITPLSGLMNQASTGGGVIRTTNSFSLKVRPARRPMFPSGSTLVPALRKGTRDVLV